MERWICFVSLSLHSPLPSRLRRLSRPVPLDSIQISNLRGPNRGMGIQWQRPQGLQRGFWHTGSNKGCLMGEKLSKGETRKPGNLPPRTRRTRNRWNAAFLMSQIATSNQVSKRCSQVVTASDIVSRARRVAPADGGDEEPALRRQFRPPPARWTVPPPRTLASPKSSPHRARCGNTGQDFNRDASTFTTSRN